MSTSFYEAGLARARERGLYETPGEVRPFEVAYTHEQARVWRAMCGNRSLVLRLAPVCVKCAAGEDQLVHLPATCEYLCRNCAGRSSSLELMAGRITDA